MPDSSRFRFIPTLQSQSVVVVDPQQLVCCAVASALEASGLKVVAEYSNIDSAIETLQNHHPNFCILDIGQDLIKLKETLLKFSAASPSTKLIILNSCQEQNFINIAMSAGASAYVSKMWAPQVLIETLNSLCKGEKQTFANGQTENHVVKTAISSLNNDPLAKLSKREREVFFLLADGRPNRVIAKQLFISPRTVETHRARVIKKLGFSSTTDLVRYAIRNNLLNA